MWLNETCFKKCKLFYCFTHFRAIYLHAIQFSHLTFYLRKHRLVISTILSGSLFSYRINVLLIKVFRSSKWNKLCFKPTNEKANDIWTKYNFLLQVFFVWNVLHTSLNDWNWSCSRLKYLNTVYSGIQYYFICGPGVKILIILAFCVYIHDSHKMYECKFTLWTRRWIRHPIFIQIKHV